MTDAPWMEQVLALGALAEGTTRPNPRVGCLVVNDGEVVGRGLHRAAGRAHAEAMALEAAGDRARGATLYVNLEPCAHLGRTPPCADLIVSSGVSRVVACMQDPNPLVDGRGFARLRGAGVRVDLGLMEAAARRLNSGFLKIHREGLPRVTLKAAISLDGMIAADGGSARWISGECSRRFAHRLRLGHDAILVGAGTVRRDDPRLTVRLPGVDVAVQSVVISPRLDLDPAAHLFRDAPSTVRPIVYTSSGADAARVHRLDGVATVVGLPAGPDGLDLHALLADLASRGLQSVLVEGGGRTLAGFLESGLGDEVALFVAHKLIGARGGTPLVDRLAVSQPDRAWRITPRTYVPLDPDLLILGELQRSPGRETGSLC